MKNTKPEIINATQKIYNNTKTEFPKKRLSKQDIDNILDAYWEYIIGEIKSGNSFQCPIGVIDTYVKRPTKKKNIATKEYYPVKESVVVRMKANSTLKKYLQQIPVDEYMNPQFKINF